VSLVAVAELDSTVVAVVAAVAVAVAAAGIPAVVLDGQVNRPAVTVDVTAGIANQCRSPLSVKYTGEVPLLPAPVSLGA